MAPKNGRSTSSLDLLELHDFAVSLGLKAGSYLRHEAASRSGLTGDRPAELSAAIKMSSVDIVTAADIECERLISEAIEERYPKHKIIGEESYSAGQEKRFLLTDEPTWIIDPLDGTVNYLHLFSQFAISIALVVNKKPVVGVIYAPFTSGVSSHPLDAQNGTLYSAATGLGSFLTPVDPSSFPDLVKPAYRKGRATCAPTQYAAPLPLLRPIAPLSPEAPKGCLFAAEWGKDRRDRPDSNLTKKVSSIWNMACEIGGRQGKGGMVHGIRSLGSAALDMAYVATGAIDIFWEAGCWEWDIAAGTCILNEAGGMVYPAQLPDGFPDTPDAQLPEADLGGRLYLAIRPCSGTDDELPRQAQDRVARAVWDRVERMDYKRPV